jgi:hypothetical protein
LAVLRALLERAGRGAKRTATLLRVGFLLSALLGTSAVFGWAAWPRLERLEQNSNLLRGMGAHDAELYAWVGANTSVDDRFLSPPAHEGFRYVAQRAVVVDWKATPMLPSEVVEWHQRVQDVVGRPVKSGRDLAGYAQLDVSRVRRLKGKYGFEFVLVQRGAHSRLSTLNEVFSNSHWVIFDVRTL